MFARGTLANLGVLKNCNVFVDGNDNLEFDASIEPVTQSSIEGFYRLPFRPPGMVNVEKVEKASESSATCEDSVLGSTLTMPLQSSTNATMVTSLTSVAVQLLDDMSEADASRLVCESAIPCVPCEGSRQPCDVATGCAEPCEYLGRPLSVFTFNAFAQIFEDVVDKAWFAWLVAQMNTLFSAGCARNTLLCASPELCGSTCAATCGADVVVGNYSSIQVEDAIFTSMATLARTEPLRLETTEGMRQMIELTASMLGVVPVSDYVNIASLCAETNQQTYNQLVKSGGARQTLAARTAVVSPPLDTRTAAQSLTDARTELLWALCLSRNPECPRPVLD